MLVWTEIEDCLQQSLHNAILVRLELTANNAARSAAPGTENNPSRPPGTPPGRGEGLDLNGLQVRCITDWNPTSGLINPLTSIRRIIR